MASNGKVSNPQSKKEWALHYAELGYKVFPLHSVQADGSCTCRKPTCGSNNIGKHPRTKGGLLDASDDPEQVAEWWEKYPEANIGCPTGAVNGFFVLDGDGPVGMQMLEKLQVPGTMVVTTGREDGGAHYWFKHPGYPVKNSVKTIPGVDVRGDGGYVILPPSQHRSGALYTWRAFEGLEECPQNVLDLLSGAQRKEEQHKSVASFTLPDQKVGEGGRSSFLTQWGGKLRRGGANEEEIFASLWAVNINRCDPPLEEEEVRRIAHSVSRYDAQDPIKPFTEDIQYPGAVQDPMIHAILTDESDTDAANVARLAALYGDKLRYDAVGKSWYVWSGVHWERDKTGFIHRAILDVARTTRLAALTLTDAQKQTRVLEVALRLEQIRKQNSLIELAEASEPFVVTIEQFDRDPLLVACENGTIDLRSGLLRESNREDLVTKKLGTYYDPEAKCPRFERYIREVFSGNDRLIEFVQRAMGYTLTGLTQEQKLFLLYGNGSNGKTKLMDVLLAIAGDYGASTSFATFEEQKSDIGEGLAALRGARYVGASERQDERVLAEGRVKMVTGEDVVTCRFLYGNPFSYKPQYKIWLSVNLLPVIRGTDDGIWRRLIIIPFKVKFEGETKDETIAEQLAAELPGILNWMLAGLRDWHEQGLNTPPEVLEYVSTYRKEQDIVLQWLEENCKVDRLDETMRGNVSALYQNFSNWAFINGFQRLSRNSFGRRMTEKGFERTYDSAGYVCYRGIRLKEAQDILGRITAEAVAG